MTTLTEKEVSHLRVKFERLTQLKIIECMTHQECYTEKIISESGQYLLSEENKV